MAVDSPSLSTLTVAALMRAMARILAFATDVAWTVMVITSVAPIARLVSFRTTVPVAPTGGLEHGLSAETNVAARGKRSDTTIPVAKFGPPLRAVTV